MLSHLLITLSLLTAVSRTADVSSHNNFQKAFSRTPDVFSDNQCVWYCSYSRRPDEVRKCEQCATDPPITYTMCLHACRNTRKSSLLSSICTKCFHRDRELMRNICKLACRNQGMFVNIQACDNCMHHFMCTYDNCYITDDVF